MAVIVTVYKKEIPGTDRIQLYFKCRGQFYKLSLCIDKNSSNTGTVSKLRAVAREMFFKATDLSPYQCSGEGLVFTGARFNASSYRIFPEFKAPCRGHEVSRLLRNGHSKRR